MKLIYLTSQRYPSKKVEPFFIKSMARAFAKILGKDFIFLVRGEIPRELESLNTLSIKVPWRFRTVSYFFSLPFFIFRHKWTGHEVVFFSSDPYLLSILIFWRLIFGFNYQICSDWHQLFEDWRDHYVAKGSDYLITTSQRLKKLLSDTGKVHLEKILVAYGGVDPSLFDKGLLSFTQEERRQKLDLPTEAFLVGYVGGFRSVGLEKGIDTMIKSLPFLDKKVTMVFVGGSKKEIEEYSVLAKNQKVESSCLFVEKQLFEKVVAYEQAMDLLVIPYPNGKHFRDYGFPMKVWEYLASGRPIVYSDLEIIREVLGGKATSFQSDNSQSLAMAIKYVVNNQNLAEVQSEQNLKNIEIYTWEARAKNIVNFLSQKR